MDYILTIILTSAVIATLLNIFFRRYEIPTVIGYILSGALINQIFALSHVRHDEGLHNIAEFGIVFLMFTIGLEFSLRHLKAMRKEVFVYGGLQMIITGNLFGAFCHEILGLDLKASIIIGFSLALSSTAIVLKMLTERNDLHSGYGRVVLGILLMQDIAVIPLLLMISLFTASQRSLVDLLLWTSLDAALLLLLIFVLGRYILERLLAWTLLADSEEIFLLAALMIVVGVSYLAHILGFSYSLGAFLAGMTLAETRFKYRIEADLMSFRDIFLGIFFVTVGMQIEIETIVKYWSLIAAILAGVMFAKALVIYIVLGRFLQPRTALKSALSLMQVGEFALAIFSIASSNRLLEADTAQILIVAVVLSMLATPFLINNLRTIADRIFSKEPEDDIPINSTGYSDHVLILGYGPLGRKVAVELKRRSVPYLIIEHDYRLVKEAKEHKEPILLANAASDRILKEAGALRAQAIVVAIENAKKTRLVVDALRRVSPQVCTVVAVRNRSQEEIIRSFGIDRIVNASELVAQKILDEVLHCSVS